MQEQSGLLLNDPDSITRSGVLNVVYAEAESVGHFDRNALFGGFTKMRALTYTSSIPMIIGILRDYDFADFECVFGHGDVLSRSAEDILSFQTAVDNRLNRGFVGLEGVAPERRELLYDQAAEGTVRFRVVRDAIAHAKIYLLETDGNPTRFPNTRVIVGSANLSETAFSGRQAETLVVFDDDATAWSHYSSQYEAVRAISTNEFPLRRKPLEIEQIRIQDVPALSDASDNEDGVILYVPQEKEEESIYAPHAVRNIVERIKPVFKKVLADRKPDRHGNLRITQSNVKEMTRIHLARQSDDAPATYLSRNGHGFTLSGVDFDLDVRPEDVAKDVSNWIEFFRNYENGFRGDVPRLQRDYFTFMSWFYFAPLMCDLRNEAMRRDVFSFDQPMFAVLYGSSNCGKTSLVDTLMSSMFANSHFVDSQDFTTSKLRGLQAAYKRFPVVFDDVARDRFSRHADEIIKDEVIPYDEYPCFVLSMNADTKNFKPEIVKRCLMIYTRTSLPGNLISERRSLQRSVSRIRKEIGTALYREYIGRVLETFEDESRPRETEDDAIAVSSGIIVDIFKEHLPSGEPMPDWCEVTALQDYQEKSFERPRLRLKQLLNPARYSNERKPPEGAWTSDSDKLVLSVPIMGATQLKSEVPDWVIDDTASTAGQIVLDKNLTEEFLNEEVRVPRRWWPFSRS